MRFRRRMRVVRPNFKTEPVRLVNNMPAVEYFRYGAELMKQNPPHVTD